MQTLTSVMVFAPASISNIGPGFDVLGAAINVLGDAVFARRTKTAGIHFTMQTRRTDVTIEPEKNVARHVAQLMMDELKPEFGVELILDKRMPVGSGLGSSAASSVAAALAFNLIQERPLQKSELLPFALEGERLASGSAHADNVAPSLLGGACLVRSYDPLDIIRLPIKNAVYWTVLYPKIVVRTEDARHVLPAEISLRKAVRQWGNVGGMVHGLIAGNPYLVGKSMEDVIVEPVRAHLIPGFYEIKYAALKEGATGCTISGSGPAIVAAAPTKQKAEKIGLAMKTVCQRTVQLESELYISKTNLTGAIRLKKGRS